MSLKKRDFWPLLEKVENIYKLLQIQTVYRRLVLHTGRLIVKHCHVLSSRNGTQQEFVCLER